MSLETLKQWLEQEKVLPWQKYFIKDFDTKDLYWLVRNDKELTKKLKEVLGDK